MLSILGIGTAYPSEKIDNQFLAGLGPNLNADSILQECSVRTRRTTLPLSYIRETKNSINRDAWKAGGKTPTDLALEATEMALQRSGLARQDIGLIIADTATPRETTPSEAQRLAKRLDLKVPCYDVGSGTGFFPAQADALNAWRSDKLPEVTLCVSTNTPTCATDYGNGQEMHYFGDAAAAVLVSKIRPGKLRVDSSYYESAASIEHSVRIGIDGFLRMNLGSVRAWVGEKTAEMLKRAVESAHLSPGSFKFVGTQFFPADLEALAARNNIADADHWRNAGENGFSFGSSAMCVIGDNWDKIKADDTIVIAQGSAGPGFGFVVLKA